MLFSASQLAVGFGEVSNSAKVVALRSHEEGFGEKGEEYLGGGGSVEERNLTDGNGKRSVNMLLCGTI